MYTEGYLIDIVEEGSWKDAKVEDSQTSEKVVVIRKTLIIEDKIGRIVKLECNETNDLKIGTYYSIFYENNKPKEIYQNKDSINEMQSEGNIIADETNINFFEVIMFTAFFILFMVAAGTVLINFPILLTLKYFVLSDVVFDGFLHKYFGPMTFCSTIISFISFCLLGAKLVKDENKANNKLIEDFRNEIKSELNKKNELQIKEKKYEIC